MPTERSKMGAVRSAGSICPTEFQNDPPRPRTVEGVYEEFRYPIDGPPCYLPLPSKVSAPFFSTLIARRTRRGFGPLSQEKLSTLLWFTSRTISTNGGPPALERVNVPRWEHRVTPSAGGRHPIDVVVMQPASESSRLALYDSRMHALRPLTNLDMMAYRRLESMVCDVISPGSGQILLHVAQPARTLAKYENGESLIWRDAGCLLATTALVAEALGLACCPLGVSGDSVLAHVLGGVGSIAGAGGCVIGSRVG